MLSAFAQKHGITYPLLGDEGSVAIRRLGLLNERVFEQHAAFGIPRSERAAGVAYPGVFLLDERGLVVEKRFLQNYRERETAAAILEQGFAVETAEHDPDAHAATDGVALRAYLDAPTYRIYQRRWLTVDLSIAPGMHVYGEPIPDGYVPLSIVVEPVDGMMAGDRQGPAPRPYRVEGLDEQFVVYEGAARFVVPLTFTRKPGDITVRAVVRLQTCSATDCLMPAAVALELPLRAENLVDLER